MTSRYDYPDPGQDPEYCDGLQAEDPEPVYCIWCGGVCGDPQNDPYCSWICSLDAEAAETGVGPAIDPAWVERHNGQ